ncbi:MAG: carbamoyltransferase HypF [Thiovulaceae bacterium]|nr:carbamoyltransferase HypF [Sulfurimonadaceae bacterium]
MSVESISKRVQVRVKGIVQGVGFRPFVYQLALKEELCGFILNDSNGVSIELQGESAAIERFLHTLRKNPPPLSRIDSLHVEELPTANTIGFTILESQKNSSVFTMISPDISLCETCKMEMQDPHNRRYMYPFINCTDCGPRYTIIRSLPYDRKNTSMKKFTMCKECQTEYEDPSNRRYHAEPISCFNCGPTLALLNRDGKQIATSSEAITITCKLIKEAKIVAIKGIGGFHIVCDALSDVAVSSLREKKKRPSKPLAVMFENMQTIERETDINEKEKALILSHERPIVIVEKKSHTTLSKLSKFVAPNIDRIGVFLPYTPLHVRLLQELQTPIVATSANLSDEPIIIDEKDIFLKLGSVVDAVLTYDREIINGCDDSVVIQSADETIVMRHSRGYAPKSLLLPQKSSKKILAVGANQKNTLALAFDENIILSPHIGDLNSLEAFEYFTRTLQTFKEFYEFEPDIIVCDQHPQYETTKWAKQIVKENPNIQLLEVQHHYAHALACMAEYNLDETVLAFCFDGTGYGDDRTLWGGEVLLADCKKGERVYHIKPFRLLGGEKAVKEPRRVALSLLFDIYTLDEILTLENETVKSFGVDEIKALHVMWKKSLNSPYTSSVGRVFDAVASLCGISQIVGYEGESGLLVESFATKIESEKGFSYSLKDGEIDISSMIQELLYVRQKEEVCSRFIITLANIILEIAQKYPFLPIVLSGGVFQNKVLVNLLRQKFEQRKLRYYIQKTTPVNDGSIALGQIYYALKNGEKYE